MFDQFDNIKRLFFKLSFRRVWWIILLFSVCFSVHSKPDDPQQIISYFEKEIQGISHQKRDSIKNALLSSYIQEHRSHGKEVALNSLQAKVDRLLNKKEENVAGNISVNNPVAPVETNRKERNDSLTTQALKTRQAAIIEPIYFDSISHFDFSNYFHAPKLSYKNPANTFQAEKSSFTEQMDMYLFQKKQRRRTVNALAISHPELIEYYNLSPHNNRARDIRQSGRRVIPVDVDGYRTSPTFEKLTDFLKPKKQSLWSSSGRLSIQFSQYYVTKNWHKGGEPNATLLSLLDYQKDYNNNNKLIWNNGLDVRIGFFNSGMDTLRAFRVNNDLVRITSRLGYQTTFHRKWYYSFYGEFNTCMFTGYAGTNSSEVVTAFFSPTRIFTSLGMDYRYNRNTAVLIAPLAHKLIFLVSNEIDPLSVGIANGKSSNSFGYLLQAKTNWKFTNEISVNSNFNLFSTYDVKNVEFNWETVGNFTINRYLTTRLSLNMRYDNTPKKPEKSKDRDRDSDNRSTFEKPRLQLQQQLSLGFFYRF